MMVKLLGLGPSRYLKDRFNIFDIIIISLSLCDFVLAFFSTSQIRKVMVIVRAMRVLRALKLARVWKSFQLLLRKMSLSLRDMVNFFFLLSIFILIYGLLGMELYQNQIKFDSNGDPVDCSNLESCSKGESDRFNFDTL